MNYVHAQSTFELMVNIVIAIAFAACILIAYHLMAQKSFVGTEKAVSELANSSLALNSSIESSGIMLK